MKKVNLLKQHKILLVLSELSKNEKKNLKFEDIAVALFRRFPDDFHLKGYKQYPDSGDSIKRPLYTFRDSGIINVRNMIFSLTDKGFDVAQKIKMMAVGKRIMQRENFDRYIEKEILRVRNLCSFKLYIEKRFDEILDTDFFDYLGTSVKASRMEFKSRFNVMSDLANILKSQKERQYKILSEFHNFMFKKFHKELDYKLKN